MKKKILLLPLLIFVICLSFGCGQDQSQYDYSKKSVFEVELLDGFMFADYHTLGPSNGVDTSSASGEYDIVAHDVVITSNPWLVYFVPKMEDETGVSAKGIEVWQSLDDFIAGYDPYYICEAGEVYKDGNNKYYDTYLLKDLSYQNIVDELYAVPYYVKDEVKNIGKIDKYSMLQYCHDFYNCKEYYDENGIITVSEMIKAAVSYATVCQKFFGYKLNQLASSEIFKYGVAYIKDTNIVFYSYSEIDDYFDTHANDVQDIEIVFDFPMESDLSLTIMDWTHKVTMDFLCDLSINSLCIYGSDVTVNGATIRTLYSNTSKLNFTDCDILNLTARTGEIECMECVINALDCNRLDKLTLTDSLIASNETINAAILDCKEVHLDYCSIRNINMRIMDSYFREECLTEMELKACNVEKSTFSGEFVNKSQLNLTGEGIYKDTKFELSTRRAMNIYDGYFDREVTLANAVLYGGHYFELEQGKNGVSCADGYMIVFEKIENAYGRFFFSCVAR